MTFVLFDKDSSLASQRVRLTLAAKGAAWVTRALRLDGDQFDPEFLKISPRGLVPALQHEGHSFVEATVICHYVDEVAPGPSLMPETPLLRARLRTIAKIVDESVHPAARVVALALGGAAFAASCDAAAADGAVGGRERLLAEQQVRDDGAESPRLAGALRDAKAFFDRLERHLSRGPFVAGEAFSLADAAALPYARRLEELAPGALLGPRPQLAAWTERLAGQPALAGVLGPGGPGARTLPAAGQKIVAAALA